MTSMIASETDEHFRRNIKHRFVVSPTKHHFPSSTVHPPFVETRVLAIMMTANRIELECVVV